MSGQGRGAVQGCECWPGSGGSGQGSAVWALGCSGRVKAGPSSWKSKYSLTGTKTGQLPQSAAHVSCSAAHSWVALQQRRHSAGQPPTPPDHPRWPVDLGLQRLANHHRRQLLLSLQHGRKGEAEGEVCAVCLLFVCVMGNGGWVAWALKNQGVPWLGWIGAS